MTSFFAKSNVSIQGDYAPENLNKEFFQSTCLAEHHIKSRDNIYCIYLADILLTTVTFEKKIKQIPNVILIICKQNSVI